MGGKIFNLFLNKHAQKNLLHTQITVEVYHNAEHKEEFTKPIKTFSKTGACKFLQNAYKKHFYDKIKDNSNAVNPDECPIMKRKFVMTDCIFDADEYTAFALAGMWKIIAYVSKDDVTRAGIQYFASVTKTE